MSSVLPLGAEAACPDEALLLELAQGAIAGAPFDALLSHLDGCAACGRIVAELARESLPAAARAASEPLPGESIDRFLLLEELGRGGMGVVFAAFDPTLDRKVALKLLRPEPLLAPAQAAPRLLAEAQALARLSHPNVVTVFEAHAHGGQVYLAMELLTGQSLRELAQARPGVTALLARFSEAGRGLQAAHDAGLVHRDFKPENALLGDDGRVCVTDFGLATPERAARAARAAPAGTPGYIAPELWLGAAPDARSDQFSFCVSLWEALFGERPFLAERGAHLLEEVRTGPLAPTRPRATLRGAVPLRVRRALVRGLRFEPAERHPSLRALLAELAPQAGPQLAPVTLAGLALALLGAGASGHALWLDARGRAAESLVAARAARPEIAPALLACFEAPAGRTPDLATAPDLAAAPGPAPSSIGLLALATPPQRPGLRPPHALVAQRRTSKPAASRAPLAELSPALAPAPGSGAGGGPGLGAAQGSSPVSPDADPPIGARTLR